MSETAGTASREDIADSDDDLDVRAMAYPTVPPISEPTLTKGMRIPSSAVPSAYDASGELYPRKLFHANYWPNFTQSRVQPAFTDQPGQWESCLPK